MRIPTFEQSFASHKKNIFWSKNNIKKSRDVFKGSGKKYLFDCGDCGHEFEAPLNSIIRGQWCNFCANRKLCDKEDCETCLNKSFASHLRSKFWSKNNGEIQPREVFKCSDNKYLFDCNKCGHEFESQLSCIYNGRWCNFCGNKELCDNSDCIICFEKSFASHYRSNFWGDNGEIQPREVFNCSEKKCLFVCEFGHKFESVVKQVSRGTWCPKCQNKTETKLYELMIQIYPSIIMQLKQDWCKKTNHLPFDFYIPEDNIIIELDGRQHFEQVKNWKSPEEQFETDKYKEKCANENGYSIIRILQEDVWKDKYDWCKELCYEIENIKNGNKVVNIYLCKNREYDYFTSII